MRSWLFDCVAVGLLILSVPALGCSDGRQPLSGTVTLDGKPLAWGSIAFHARADAIIRSSGSSIAAGEFSIPRDQGLTPGVYDVSIEAVVETGKMVNDDQDGRMIARETVKFREAGQLQATITDNGENRFQFDLTRAR
jgi:hypothetical protein